MIAGKSQGRIAGCTASHPKHLCALVGVMSQDWHLLLCPFLGPLKWILGFRLHNPAGITGFFLFFFVEADGILHIRVVFSSLSLQMGIIISSVFHGL